MKGVYFLFTLFVISLFADQLAPYDYAFQDSSKILISPDFQHWLGTDALGRDLFSRILFGAKISLFIGLITSVFSVVVGMIYGAVSAWYGGRIDWILMRALEVFMSIPHLILIILSYFFVETMISSEDENLKALIVIFISITITSWFGVARTVRALVLKLKSEPFVEAGIALGATPLQILWRHIVPHLWGSVLVLLTFQVPSNMMYESALSFMGFGLAPPYASWGVLAHEGWRSLSSYPRLIIVPGFFLFLTVWLFNIVAENLRKKIR